MLKPSIVALPMMVLGTGVVFSQAYPGKPIRIVTSTVASGNDFAARLIAQAISGPLGQQVVVDNRNRFEIEAVARASPDGYTLFADGSALWLGPLIENRSFDPVKDATPISKLVSSPNILVVHPSLPVQSVKELIAFAKARPAVLNYGAGGTGGSAHLAAELFKAMADLNIVRIAYKGTGPALTALMAGEVQVSFAVASSVAPFVKSGRLRALAVASAQSSPLAPGLPTVAASGLPGFESESIAAIFAPAKTPDAIISRLNTELVRALNQTDVKEKFFNVGAVAVGSSRDELAAAIKSEITRMGKVIKDAGIRAD